MQDAIEPTDDACVATLRMQYQELCKSHNGVAEFRGKLLALLPLATGAAVLSLVGKQTSLSEIEYLWVIAIFGFVISSGLFFYELRGMQICHQLQDRGARLESRLGIGHEFGQFTRRPSARLKGLIGVEGAGWLIYPAVLVAWTYLAGLSLDLWQRQPWLRVAPATVYLVLVTYTWVRLWRGVPRRLRDSSRGNGNTPSPRIRDR